MPRYTTPPSLGIFTDFEVAAFLRRLVHPRDKALISILWLTGARIGEILLLTKDDILIDDNELKIRLQTFKKRRKENENKFMINYRTIEFERNTSNVIVNQCVENIIAYYNTVQGARLFPISQRWARTIVNRVTQESIEKVLAPHHFRHSRFTFLAEKNIPINLLLHMKGASDLKSIVPYLQAKKIKLNR